MFKEEFCKICGYVFIKIDKFVAIMHNIFLSFLLSLLSLTINNNKKTLLTNIFLIILLAKKAYGEQKEKGDALVFGHNAPCTHKWHYC